MDNYPGVKHETTRDKMKKERKEYVNKMIDLDNNSPKEFQGLELVNSQEVENEKFQNQTKKLIGKKRKNVKPFKHMGTKEEQIPMLQKLLKEEAGVKEEAGEPEPANNFLETCTGTGQFLTQAPYQHFTIADLDDNVTNFYKVANKDPHNLEISGRVTKGKLKKQQDWANVWDETKKKVNPENEATTDSEKAEKAAAFMLYRNAKKNDYTTDENYEEKPQDFKKGSHKMAYQKDDMKVLLHQLDKLPETEIVTDKFQNTLQKYGSNKDLIYIDPPYVKFTYSEKPPEKENSSTGQYSHGMSYEEQTQSIEQLGEIVKQKSLEESNTKPQVIGYSNMATLDLVKHCIDSGATKIYLYTKRRQKGFHVEMLAIFKGTTSKDSQTLAQK
ncbi:DNA adenine methylase, partial [Hyella patelloides]|uniref:DNA adenine methylase n=1 Tax=Hyella patelloides TaxID=1982969 RepID=UPI00119F12F4